MKKVPISLLIFAMILLISATGFTANDQHDVTLTIDSMVGISITETNVPIHISTVPGSTFPVFYPNPLTGIHLSVYCNDPSGYQVTAKSNDANFGDANLPVTQLYVGEHGVVSRTADGGNPTAGGWKQMKTTDVTIISDTGAPTNGWESKDQDYEFGLEADDPPITSGTVTIVYTITIP